MQATIVYKNSKIEQYTPDIIIYQESFMYLKFNDISKQGIKIALDFIAHFKIK